MVSRRLVAERCICTSGASVGPYILVHPLAQFSKIATFMMGAEVCSFAQRCFWLDMDEHRSHIAVAHQRESQSLDTVVSVEPIGNGAGAKIVRDQWNVLVLGVIHDFRPIVPGLKPGILANSVQTVELVEYLDQCGISCNICHLVVSRLGAIKEGEFVLRYSYSMSYVPFQPLLG